MNHLYVTDLDGTLLHRNVSVSEWSRNKLCELLEEGLHFTVATARSVVSVKEILHGIPLTLPIIGGNGAYISDFQSGEHLYFRHLPRPIAQEIAQLLDERGYTYFLAAQSEGFDRLYYERATNEAGALFLKERKAIGDTRLQYCPSLLSQDLGHIITISVPERPEVCLDLKLEFEMRYPEQLEIHIYDDAKPVGWHWMSIHDTQATKANGISTVIQDFGYQEGELTVFGDSTNDVSMFRLAPRAIAVENAKTLLKAHATHTIGHHEEDSVIKFIERDWRRNQV